VQHAFYNISRIMDCISCDKCRFNGKVQVRGLATILKVLFLPDTPKKYEIMKQFSNQELVSTIQLLSKLSEALNIIEKNRVEELTAENLVKFNKQFSNFMIAFIGTIMGMFIFGFQTEKGIEWEKERDRP